MKAGLIITTAQIIFALLLSGSASGEEQIKEFSDPVLFWQETIAGNITKIVGQDESSIIFEYNDGGNMVKARVDKKLIENNDAKTKGSIRAMNILISRLEQEPKDQAAYAKTSRRLVSLSGQNIETPSAWRKWYEEHKDRLVWSDQKNRLVLENSTN